MHYAFLVQWPTRENLIFFDFIVKWIVKIYIFVANFYCVIQMMHYVDNWLRNNIDNEQTRTNLVWLQ